MNVEQHQKDESDQSSLVTRKSPFLAFWRAPVTKYDIAFFQVRTSLPALLLM
jgi:hypothetical protein